MCYEIMQPGAFAFLKVQLEAGESIKAESDAMMAMSGNIKVEGKMEGGMLGGLARKFLSGESLLSASDSTGASWGGCFSPADTGRCFSL